MSKYLTIAFLLLAFVPISMAQHGSGFGHSGGGFGHSRSRGLGRNAIFFGDPFWFDDYPSGSMASAGPTQPIIAVPRPSSVSEPERITTPLLIEWQGDRYVRLASAASDRLPDYSQAGSTQLLGPPTRPPELPPAILIFRDGHQELVSDYVITRGVLYAQSDYALTGAATHNIQLAALDLPATLQANRHNGLNFVLPNSPNEVVTRP